MFNRIFKENVKGQKEPELLTYRKPKYVIKINRMAIKIPMTVAAIMMK